METVREKQMEIVTETEMDMQMERWIISRDSGEARHALLVWRRATWVQVTHARPLTPVTVTKKNNFSCNRVQQSSKRWK